MQAKQAVPGLIYAPLVNDLGRVATARLPTYTHARVASDSNLLSPIELAPWQEAARNFVLNTDFDVSSEIGDRPLPLSNLMAIMKKHSGGKRTIQAIGDKIILNALVDNINVAQMPALYASHGSIYTAQVRQLVASLESSGEEDAFDIVCKPTHLSNCTGTLILSNEVWEESECNADTLIDHMGTYITEKAHETESAALQSLMPGFLIQPLYKSCFDWDVPIEIRVFTLWGKTRLGVWWWGGRDANNPDIKWERNAWIVRGQRGEWRTIHENPQRTREYEQSLQLILQQMPEMCRSAEKIATAIGTPFLRSDFFVGSSKWGMRLNEVAYGSNIDMRRAAPGPLGYADDSDVIAQILHEGYKHCRKQPPEYFLGRLGAEGNAYEPEWWKFWSGAPGLQVSPTRKVHGLRSRAIC